MLPMIAVVIAVPCAFAGLVYFGIRLIRSQRASATISSLISATGVAVVILASRVAAESSALEPLFDFEKNPVLLALVVPALKLPWLVTLLAGPVCILILRWKSRQKAWFDILWSVVCGAVLTWVAVASSILLLLAVHAAQPVPRRAGVAGGHPEDFFLWLSWWRVLLPAYPTCFLTLIGWRPRLRVTLSDVMLATAVCALQLGLQQQIAPHIPKTEQHSHAQLPADLRLDANGNPHFIEFYRDTRLDLFQGSIQLRELHFGPTPVAPASLKALGTMPNLQKLTMAREYIVDEHLRYLSDVTQLKELDIRGANVTESGLRWIAALPNLERLNIGRIRITENGCEILSHAPRLQELHLDESGLTDAGLAHLAKLPQLGAIYAVKTLVTGSAFCTSSGFSEVSMVWLDGCPIDEGGLRCIANLPKVRLIGLTKGTIPRSVLDQISGRYDRNARKIDIMAN